jgi:D-amino-acid oxidase
MDAIVVGAGVNGLTCAVLLAEAGFGVEVWSEREPARTTSAVAAAMWLPYAAQPTDRVLAWARHSHRVFGELSREPASQVSMVPLLDLEPPGVHGPAPWWGAAASGYRAAQPTERPPGRTGFVAEIPVVEMPDYLGFLLRRLESAGGNLRIHRLETLTPVLTKTPLVVNCSGLGARELIGDDSLFPIRGQVLRVAQSNLRQVLVDDHNPGGLTYIIPRRDDIVLGGTHEPNRYDLEPDPTAETAIRARCAALEPSLASAPVLSTGIGLRPGRPAVRLELEAPSADQRLIHNYGHGGCGVTLSWGCAAEVLSLATR